MNEKPLITCRELIEFLMEYVEGTMDSARRAEFDRHLAVCPSCVAYVQGYIETIRLGRESMRTTDDAAPPGVPEALVRAIMAAREKS